MVKLTNKKNQIGYKSGNKKPKKSTKSVENIYKVWQFVLLYLQLDVMVGWYLIF